MRGSLTYPIKKSRMREAQAKLQTQAKDNKMSELELMLNNIRNAKLDEY